MRISVGILVSVIILFIVFKFVGTTPRPDMLPSPASSPQIADSQGGRGTLVAPGGSAAPKARVAEKPQLTSEEQKHIEDLKEILASKNDNDPRLDSELKVLSPAMKEALKQQYSSMRAEQFNDKGTLVFLIGRNLNSPEDFDFLSHVLSEPPCYNMADCSKPKEKVTDPEVAHTESINDVTLNYPKIVALKSLESALENETQNPALRERIFENLRIAANSKTPMISKAARDILQRHSP